MDPGPFFYTDKTPTAITCSVYLLQALFSLIPLQTNISFHTRQLILCFQQNRWDWQPHCKLGQSILVVLCASSTLLLTPVVRPAEIQLATPSEVTPFSYWSIKPWFLTEGKLATVLIIPSSWGSPTVCNLRSSSSFSGAVAAKKEDFCKGSLSSPISLLCYSFG